MKRKLLTASLLVMMMSITACTKASKPSDADSTTGNSLPDTVESANDSDVEESTLTPSASESENTNTTESEGTEKSWTDEQANLMKEHLYGEVLPFIDFEDITVEWNDYTERLEFESVLLKEGDLEAYAEKFPSAVWEGGDISSSQYAPTGSVYYFEKAIKTSNGTRYVDVIFYGYDEDEWGDYDFSLSGNFFMAAYDPYYYEFPTDFAQYAAYLVSTQDLDEYDELPAFDADYYGVNYNNPSIYCFLTSLTPKSDDAGYSAKLKKAGWTVLEDKDEHGYYVAVSPNEQYQIAYLFDYEYNDLDIYFETYIKTYSEWNDDEINAEFTRYGANAYSIPSIEYQNAKYYYVDDEYNEFYVGGYEENISGYVVAYNASRSDFNTYLEKLSNNGWVVACNYESEYGDDEDDYHSSYSAYTAKKFEDDGTYNMTIEFYDINGKTQINLTYYLFPSEATEKTWPAEGVQEVLDGYFGAEFGYSITDTIPDFTGDAYGFVQNGNVIEIYVEDGTALDKVKEYGKVLEDAGYHYVEPESYDDDEWDDEEEETEYFAYTFYSPNYQFDVTVSIGGNYGTVEVYISLPFYVETENFPTAALNKTFANYSDVSLVPELTGATLYGFNFTSDEEYNDHYGSINANFGEEDGAQKFEAYCQALEDAGFKCTYQDEDGYYANYRSPNEQFDVQVSYYDYENVISLFFDDIDLSIDDDW